MEERGRFVGCAAILETGTQRASMIQLSDTKDLHFLPLVSSIIFLITEIKQRKVRGIIFLIRPRSRVVHCFLVKSN